MIALPAPQRPYPVSIMLLTVKGESVSLTCHVGYSFDRFMVDAQVQFYLRLHPSQSVWDVQRGMVKNLWCWPNDDPYDGKSPLVDDLVVVP